MKDAIGLLAIVLLVGWMVVGMFWLEKRGQAKCKHICTRITCVICGKELGVSGPRAETPKEGM